MDADQQTEARSGPRTWSLNRILALLVLGAFAGLLLEIRYDHREVIRETPVAWTPLIYSGVTILLGLVGIAFWRSWGRTMLLVLFAIGIVVGPLGFWFHNMGRPVKGVQRMLAAWEQPVMAANKGEQDAERAEHGESPEKHEGGHEGGVALERPPILAPLSFFGLGLIGVLVCLSRFQPAGDRS